MADPARICVTDAEIDAAIARARSCAKYDRRLLKATYSSTSDRLRLVFEDGAIFALPRKLLQGLGNASPAQLRRIQILGDGTGLLWPLLDVAHHVASLVGGTYGNERWMTRLSLQRSKPRLVKQNSAAYAAAGVKPPGRRTR